MKKYGRTEEEKQLEKTIQCREIVKEILNFGVSEFQKVKIIHFLSLEMENREDMLQLSNICKDILNEKEEESNKQVLTLN
jgi:hypothetical protein